MTVKLEIIIKINLWWTDHQQELLQVFGSSLGWRLWSDLRLVTLALNTQSITSLMEKEPEVGGGEVEEHLLEIHIYLHEGPEPLIGRIARLCVSSRTLCNNKWIINPEIYSCVILGLTFLKGITEEVLGGGPHVLLL